MDGDFGKYYKDKGVVITGTAYFNDIKKMDSGGDIKSVGEILIYQLPDMPDKIEVRLEGETIWLTQSHMAELFNVNIRTISYHIINILKDNELEEFSTIQKNWIVQKEGNREVKREVEFYNLDMIISVGYRVNSKRGTQFRIWATQRLKDVKGYAISKHPISKEHGL